MGHDFSTTIIQKIQTTRATLMDLHDPSGVYFYRAWNACLARLIAAMGLCLAPAIAQPLLVIAAIIFTNTTSDRDRPSHPTVLFSALIAVY